MIKYTLLSSAEFVHVYKKRERKKKELTTATTDTESKAFPIYAKYNLMVLFVCSRFKTITIYTQMRSSIAHHIIRNLD